MMTYRMMAINVAVNILLEDYDLDLATGKFSAIFDMPEASMGSTLSAGAGINLYSVNPDHCLCTFEIVGGTLALERLYKNEGEDCARVKASGSFQNLVTHP